MSLAYKKKACQQPLWGIVLLGNSTFFKIDFSHGQSFLIFAKFSEWLLNSANKPPFPRYDHLKTNAWSCPKIIMILIMMEINGFIDVSTADDDKCSDILILSFFKRICIRIWPNPTL